MIGELEEETMKLDNNKKLYYKIFSQKNKLL